MDIKEAQKLIEQDRIERYTKCMEEIKIILNKYGFEIRITQPSIMLVETQKINN